MATKTQIRFTLALAVGLAALSIAMPHAAHAFYRGAPEVDPSTLSSAIALVIGGAAMLTDRFRK